MLLGTHTRTIQTDQHHTLRLPRLSSFIGEKLHSRHHSAGAADPTARQIQEPHAGHHGRHQPIPLHTPDPGDQHGPAASHPDEPAQLQRKQHEEHGERNAHASHQGEHLRFHGQALQAAQGSGNGHTGGTHSGQPVHGQGRSGSHLFLGGHTAAGVVVIH